MTQHDIMDEILDLAREIEPLQKRINDLAEMDLKLDKNDEDWDKDRSESIQSWRTYN